MLYIYIDEAGDLGFNNQGTEYFILCALSTQRPFWWYPSLCDLKYNIIAGPPQVELECFHACNDNKYVKAQMFDLIAQNLNTIRVDAVIAQKRKAHPTVQQPQRFYSDSLKCLVKYVINGWKFQGAVPQTIMIADRAPYSGKKRGIVEGAAKSALKVHMGDTPWRLYFHASSAHGGLQVADYFGWALQRHWERSDPTFLEQVAGAVKSQFEVYKSGQIDHY